MAGFKSVDLGFASSHRVEDMVRWSQLAEAEGFDAVWLAELYYARGLITTCAAVAAATSKIKIGFGIISPFSRHPGVVAMETATLDELSGGRMILGMGISQIAVDRQGIGNARAAVSLREAMDILRLFFAGEQVVYDGEFFKMTAPGSSLFFEPVRRDVPIHLGVMGPKSLELAGRAADGVLLGMFSTPGFAKWARGHIEKGLASAGRSSDDFEYRSYITFSVDKDAAKAKDAVRGILAAYLSEGVSTSATNAESPRWKYSGATADELLAVKAEVGKYWSQGDREKAGQAIPVDFIDKLIVAGEPDECAERLLAYAEAGVDIAVPYQVMGPDPDASIRLAAREILPKITL